MEATWGPAERVSSVSNITRVCDPTPPAHLHHIVHKRLQKASCAFATFLHKGVPPSKAARCALAPL